MGRRATHTSEPAATGALRIWSKDGTSLRDPNPLHLGGDLIEPNSNLDIDAFWSLVDSNNEVTLWIEAVRPATSAADELVSVVVLIDEVGPCIDAVRVTPTEIEFHDARAWQPSWDQWSGLSFAATDFIARYHGVETAVSHPVDGVITDGASLCVIRLRPWYDSMSQVFSDLSIDVVKAGSPSRALIYRELRTNTLHSGDGCCDRGDSRWCSVFDQVRCTDQITCG